MQDKKTIPDFAIHAHVFDPRNSLFPSRSNKAQTSIISCAHADTCSLHAQGTCLRLQVLGSCPFGNSHHTTGPTPRARGLSSWLTKERERTQDIPRLHVKTQCNRIARMHDSYYLPYAHMCAAKSPFPRKWVKIENFTADRIDAVTRYQPRDLFGHVIADYQKNIVPKFLADLRDFVPEIFAQLPNATKARLDNLSYIGRKADITTCQPGSYAFGNTTWTWDGAALTSTFIHLAPVKGDTFARIIPDPGQPVTITRNDQVGPDTVFLD